MASTISMVYISFIILVVLAVQATNSVSAAKMTKINPITSRFQPGKVHKIIGGTPATLGEIPYQVEILRNKEYWCGGSLVSPTFVVSAAHCLDGVPKNQLIVRAGHISHLNPGKNAQTRQVKSTKVHEMWNGQTSNQNDIGVLKLNAPMQINEFVKTINVPCQDCPIGIPTVNQVLLASGWGRTETGNSSPVLMKVNLKVVSQTKCNELWEGTIKSGQMCAGTNGNSTCFGDSGGPLANQSGIITLMGLTSFGNEDCNTNDDPAVFTRVHEYSVWINRNIK